tara:strand:- start:14 stop:214 length:201 start_codon:yes stop_codon:yes gene_type:complete
MKVGDLVKYNEYTAEAVHRGIVVDGPKECLEVVSRPIQWQVAWFEARTIGWWNEELLEVVSELPNQ